MMRDIRYALRVLKTNPGFASAAVLTLALGIGLNATIFSIFDAMALRPVMLPPGTPAVAMYQDIRGGPGRYVDGGPNLFSYPEFQDYQQNTDVLWGLTAYTPEFRGLVDADVKPVRGQLTACNYFAVLRVSPARGRAFLPNECTATDAGPVAVISDAFWRSHFGSDSSIIGKTLKLNRIPLTVIGVAPPGFAGIEISAASFWVPMSMQWSLSGRTDPQPYQSSANTDWLTLVGRLQPGVSIDQARAKLAVVAARRDAQFKDRVTTLSLGEPNFFGRPDKRRAIFAVGAVFLAAVGLVLLVACANVANLFLARAAARQREIAIRIAIGASRVQLIRQLLVESSLIALAGGVLGTAVSAWSAKALVTVLLNDPSTDPLSIVIAQDVRVFAYSLLLVFIAVLAFGLAPALQATRLDVNTTIRTGSEMGDPRRKLRSSLVGVQVGVSTVLLVVAGLLLRSVEQAQRIDPGFVFDHATTLTFDLHAEAYTQQRAVSFHRDLTASFKSIPGVEVVAEAATAPLASRQYFGQFGPPAAPRREQMRYNTVTPGFFSAVGIAIVRGRDFAAGDIGGRFAIVSEAGARLFWPGQDPIGKSIKGDQVYTVIGVARDAQVSELGQRHEPFLYFAARDSDALELSSVIVRSAAPEATVSAAMRAAALGVDHDLHFRVAPLRENMRPYIQASRFLAILSSTLAALALFLASLGIYGTVAFVVARRTREIGIRMALGSHKGAVVALITRQAMRPVCTAAIVGLSIAALGTRALQRVLFGVSAWDAVAFLTVPVVLTGVALVASYVPARRAARVDPLVALRAD